MEGDNGFEGEFYRIRCILSHQNIIRVVNRYNENKYVATTHLTLLRGDNSWQRKILSKYRIRNSFVTHRTDREGKFIDKD